MKKLNTEYDILEHLTGDDSFALTSFDGVDKRTGVKKSLPKGYWRLNGCTAVLVHTLMWRQLIYDKLISGKDLLDISISNISKNEVTYAFETDAANVFITRKGIRRLERLKHPNIYWAKKNLRYLILVAISLFSLSANFAMLLWAVMNA